MKIALCELNTEEKIKFDEKISALTTFRNVFGNNIVSFRSISNRFTKKEILSSNMNDVAISIDAPENIFNRVEYVSYNVPKYINDAKELGIVTEETMDSLFDTILTDSTTSLKYLNEYTFWGLFGRGKKIFNKIIDMKKTHIFESRNIINMIDNTIANDDFDDSFVDKVLESFPDYNGFILTLTNPNVEYDKKYTILKKSFKQKYFNDYVIQLSKNLDDLNDLDTFIDVTILNNNRIKEKTKNIWNVFRRIFIGTKLTHVTYRSNLKNKKAFFDKYSKYLTPAEIAKFAEDMYSDYSITENFSDLIRDMYDNLTLDDKLDLCISNDYVFRQLISGSDAVLKIFTGSDDIRIKNKAIQLGVRRNSVSGLSGLVNLFSKDIINYINDHFDNKIISEGSLAVSSGDDAGNAKYFAALNPELLKLNHIYNPRVVKKLFIIADTTHYRAIDTTNRMKNFVSALLKQCSDETKAVVYDDIFSFLESDDDCVSLIQFGSDVIADRNQYVKSNYGHSYWSSGCDIKQLILTNARWFKETLEKYFPEKTEAMTNLDNFIDSYELLANI